jgi:phosphopantothenoylcysteine decarboxylase / phosphopantothenate---cysteine ligase
MINPLKNKKILITLGPTKEYLDPVRFISNNSSGKMGFAIAEQLFNMGCEVVIVSGPVSVASIIPSSKIISVTTGKEMYTACKTQFNDIDIAIFCAAVSDYTPKVTSETKIKKSDNEINLVLEKNVDIAFEFGKIKNKNQKSIGFALETDHIYENSVEKLKKKNFDLIVINSPKENEGFGYDTNKISILERNLVITEYPLKSKTEVSLDIVNSIIQLFSERQ